MNNIDKRTNHWRSALAAIVLLMSIESVAQSPKMMSDPLFGITYNPQQVHFERMPASLSTNCPRLRGRYVEAWIYGHLKTAESEYFLISGLIEIQEDKSEGFRTIAPEEGDGVIVAVRRSKCLIDQTDYFFTQNVNPAKQATPIKAPESVLNEILADALDGTALGLGENRSSSVA